MDVSFSNMSTRWICNILEGMRTCIKTANYSYLPGLIEEAQYRAERMENALDIKDDCERYEKARVKLKAEIKKLEAKRDELEVGEV